MRRVRLGALMIALSALLASCAPSMSAARARAAELRTEFNAAERITALADITADCGDKVYDFTVEYSDCGGEGTAVILKPDIVAGVTARVSDGGAVIEYDGISVEIGPLTRDGLSPAAALPLMLEQWKSGYVTDCTAEKLDGADALAVTTTVSSEVTLRTWFDAESGEALYAELSENGRTVVFCEFENVTIE